MPEYEVDIRVQAEATTGDYLHNRDESERRFVRSVRASSPQEAMHAAVEWVTSRLAEETLLG